MPRNIVLCCDGTANEFARHNTNVVKLYAMLQRDPAVQVTYYHPGLGTMEPAGALTTLARRTTKVLGRAIGYGLADDIRDAYVFLMRNFEPGDEVYLFGFSRGAYTARAVASLLRMYGLVQPDNDALVPYVIRMMMSIKRADGGTENQKKKVKDYFDLASAFRTGMARADCRPRFVGVWDTVSSVGWIENPLKLPYITNNPDIEIGRHAIAIDERRAFFRNHLWRAPADPAQPRGPRDVKQVWFPGVHCDVGGGYPEAESGLSNIALEWMVDEAEAAGLKVDQARRAEILGRPAQTCMHESLKGWWHLAEYVPKKHFDRQTQTESRRINRHRRREIPRQSFVHAAAFERGEEYCKRLPPDAVRVDRKTPASV
jgi:uncharacterized protein (DUF2235 family)